MTVAEKIGLVREVAPEFPVPIALRALGLSRSSWYYHRQPRPRLEDRYAHLRPLLELIAREHPEYGYRRVTVELRESHDQLVNHKVVQKLHQLWELPLIRSIRAPKKSLVRRVIEEAGERANLLVGIERIDPFEVLYTDFTEIVYADGAAKAYLIALPDHASKYVVGAAVGERANTVLALKAWDRASQQLARFNRSTEGLIVHHDQDPVFTSMDWTRRLLLRDGVRLSYALHGARDNPEMESFWGRFKTENRSLLLDAQSLQALGIVIDERLRYFNEQRRHSTLDYETPLGWLRKRSS